MILLDSDHFTILQRRDSPQHAPLLDRLSQAGDPRVALPIIVIEEQFRGWTALIARYRRPRDQVFAYGQLAASVRRVAGFEIVDFGAGSCDQFERLQANRIRVGTMDLKIASIALEHGALLLSANLSDFIRVPGLRVEDWISAPSLP